MKVNIQASRELHAVCVKCQFLALAFFDIRQWYETNCIIRILPCHRNMSTKSNQTWTTISVTYVNSSLIMKNKLSISFGEDKTKSILFGTKSKLRKAGKVNTTYLGIDIKQNPQVIYLGCILDEIMPGEPIAHKNIKKTNSTLNFLFRKKQF